MTSSNRSFVVQEPMSAIQAIRKLFPDSSRRTLQNWIRGGRFQADGKKIEREQMELQPGQEVTANETCRPQPIRGLRILHLDRWLIAIDKKEGLLSVPLDESEGASALTLLREHFATDQIYAVHRIDRETSGCLLFARGKEAEERLKDLFEAHDLLREYIAVVEGHLPEKRGTWQSKLLELENYRVVESIDGRDAITHFEQIRTSPKYTYLRLRLETGRKHQIRVHCANMGHPVLGDARYGSIENPIRRLCLHARRLELVHPFTKKLLKIESPLPAAFNRLGAGIIKSLHRSGQRDSI